VIGSWAKSALRSARVKLALATVVAAIATAGAGALGEGAPPRPRFASRLLVMTLVDHSRQLQIPHRGTGPRTLVTYVRYPTLVAGSVRGDRIGAPPARADGPFPLVVFAHGFNVTPAAYTRLLEAWTRAGYVVAAPVFPRQNANAPGGPDEADIVNQPADISFVISQLLAESAAPGGTLSGLINPTHVAVAGHSDGAETALAVADDRYYRDSRVTAAVILSGASFGDGGLRFPQGSPPLLATLGTADTTNPPRNVRRFYGAARRPKYLLSLIGAGHLPPYSGQYPWLGIVERVSTAFLDLYLKQDAAAAPRLSALGTVPGRAILSSQP
jgi:dienelactone hydrolase